MAGTDRLTALCEQQPPVLTGIDFIQVDDPATQTLLRVFFLIDPDDVTPPWAIIPALPAPPQSPFPAAGLRIVSVSGGDFLAEVAVQSARFVRGIFAGQERVVLEIETAEPGDFSLYELSIDSNRLDPFYNHVEFSFKQGCPSRFDCQEKLPPCPNEALVDFPVDYLARDFTSIRSALLDFAAQRYPAWQERVEADAGVMLAEVMAALGDEFSYLQDRYAREAHFESATQRRSLRGHSALVDYPIHEGLSATTWLSIQASVPGVFINAGTRVWGRVDDGSKIPFEIGTGLRDTRSYWIHEAWSTIQAHVPDAAHPCLPTGSTEIFLRGHFPLAMQQPNPASVGAADDSGSWLGRLVVLRSLPTDPSLPDRHHPVRVTGFEHRVDELCRDAGGDPIPYTRITWKDSEALPFDLHLPSTTALANIVPATAGATVIEHFVIGRGGNVSLPPTVTHAVERAGAANELTGTRSVTYLHSLRATETRGFGWLGRLRQAAPEIELLEADPATLVPLIPSRAWTYAPSLLEAGSQERFFTLENGTWKTLFEVERLGRVIRHDDYANASGFTVRFGDGEFGVTPPVGTVFRARYRTGAGTGANLPKDTVTLITNPGASGPPTPTLTGIAVAVDNPFAITTGIDPESAASLKQLAPAAFRADTLRAVRDEDYRIHAERVPGVQQAGASARWTGSWLSEFVTVDPVGTFAPSPVLRGELQRVLDCVRQVGREVFVRDPRYLNLDLEIQICLHSSAYAGQVQERVIAALTVRQPGLYAPLPFFHPDRFTFGTPLYRAALEAAVQAVPGVLAVEVIRIRVRGITDWRVLDETRFTVSNDQILRLQNDPRFPARGSLMVRTH